MTCYDYVMSDPDERFRRIFQCMLSYDKYEEDAFVRWRSSHQHGEGEPDPSYEIRISGKSGIGNSMHVYCNCGHIQDITDYGSW